MRQNSNAAYHELGRRIVSYLPQSLEQESLGFM
jgi:hypothetical protein